MDEKVWEPEVANSGWTTSEWTLVTCAKKKGSGYWGQKPWLGRDSQEKPEALSGMEHSLSEEAQQARVLEGHTPGCQETSEQAE